MAVRAVLYIAESPGMGADVQQPPLMGASVARGTPEICSSTHTIRAFVG
jgi:hypothetical protein